MTADNFESRSLIYLPNTWNKHFVK